MPASRLTQCRTFILKSRRETYDIRDAEIKGFGVRILPSARNRFRHAIGDAKDGTLECARTQARALPAPR